MATSLLKKNRVGRVTERLQMLLVDYMSTHSDFAAGRFTGPMGVERQGEQWERLSGRLNECGPCKNVEQWKKTWRDLKRTVRAKASRINVASRATGNLPVQEELTMLEGKCLAVIGEEVAVGLNVQEIGHGSMSTPSPMTFPEEVPVTHDRDDDAGPSNAAVPSEHLEIIVNDLFTPEQSEAPRRKGDGDLQKATALIVEAMKKNASENLVNERCAAALEKQAEASQMRAAAAVRKAAAAERKAAAAEKKAAVAERRQAVDERRGQQEILLAARKVVAAERRAAAAERATDLLATAVSCLGRMSGSMNE